jgi:hypothetical protein
MKIVDRRRHEGGSALLIAMLFAVLMGLIGFASLDTVMRDRQSAGFQNLSHSALYAADAGIAQSLNILRSEIVGNALAPNDCLTTTLPATNLGDGVSYRADPNAAPQICMLSSAEPCAEFDSSIEQGQSIYLYTVWNMRVEGSAPGGATAYLQASAERCHAFNN